jgi:hypothetical protein
MQNPSLVQSGKSTNGGVSFNSAMNGIDGSEPTNWSTPVVMDPNSIVMFCITVQIIFTEQQMVQVFGIKSVRN